MLDPVVFVQNIKKYCERSGIKPTVACRESGVGTSFINNIERGQTPSVSKVQMLADYLGVTTSELLGETPQSPVILEHTIPANHDVDELLQDLKTLAPFLLEQFEHSCRKVCANDQDSSYTIELSLRLCDASLTGESRSEKHALQNQAVSSSSEDNLVHLFRSLPIDQQEAVIKIVRAAARNQGEVEKNTGISSNQC